MVYPCYAIQRRCLPISILHLFQALSIMKEVEDRDGEAKILSGIAGVYRRTGKPQEALELFKRILSLRRELEDRAEEAATLNNMATVYRALDQPEEALKLYEQALPIMREMENRAGEAT